VHCSIEDFGTRRIVCQPIACTQVSYQTDGAQPGRLIERQAQDLEIIQNFGRVNRKEYKGRRRGR